MLSSIFALFTIALTPQPITLTIHDGTGHIHHVTAQYTSFSYDAGSIALDIQIDGLFCDSFGG